MKKIFFSYSVVETIEIPANIEEIRNSVFCSCFKLTVVSFVQESKLRIIGSSSFEMNNVKSIVFPALFEEIEHLVFFHCKNLSEVTFSRNSKLKIIKMYAFCMTNMSHIEFPSLEEIGIKAFADCKCLT